MKCHQAKEDAKYKVNGHINAWWVQLNRETPEKSHLSLFDQRQAESFGFGLSLVFFVYTYTNILPLKYPFYLGNVEFSA